MNLIVDAGNTTMKLAVFDMKSVVFNQITASDFFIEKVKSIFQLYPKISWAIISSVRNIDKKEIEVLSNLCKVHVLNHKSKIPFKNLYATPKTLGVDRIALVTSAFYYNPKHNSLVIDAGTCITYDFINENGEYLGGAISLGLTMRYKAIHQQTSKLPLLEKKEPFDFIGDSTEASMHSGVVNGICVEIDAIIEQYSSRFSDLTVILTGGDAQFLSNRLKNTIFANSKFLLDGLNYLLEYNKY